MAVNKAGFGKRVLFAALLLAGGALFLLLSTRHEQHAYLLKPDDAATVSRGRQVYAANCASCHGATLAGQANWRQRDASGLLPAPPHNEAGHTWHHPDKLLFDITRNGVAAAVKMPGYQSTMPAFKDSLSDADIIAALSWIKSRWPAEIRRQQDEVNRLSARR